eukprot:1333928-Rhodomonas_salina.1
MSAANRSGEVTSPCLTPRRSRHWANAVLFKEACKPVVDDGRGNLVQRPEEAYWLPMAHLSDRVLLQEEQGACPAPRMGHVPVLQDLVDTGKQGSREVHGHLGIVLIHGGVGGCSVHTAQHLVGHPIIPM